MNWFKKAKNFVKKPQNINEVIDEIINIIRNADIETIEDEGSLVFLKEIKLFYPYLNIEAPLFIYIDVDNIIIGVGALAGADSNLYDIIFQARKEGREFQGFDIADEGDDGRVFYDMMFSGEYDDGDLNILQNSIYISLDLAEEIHKGRIDRDVRDTINHELTHLLDPNSTSSVSNSKERREDYYGDRNSYRQKYFFYPEEITARISSMEMGILSNIREYSGNPSKAIEQIDLFIDLIKSGDMDEILEILINYIGYDTVFEISEYYLPNPQLNRDIIQRTISLLLKLREQYQNNELV
jgi:hypothetical protein